MRLPSRVLAALLAVTSPGAALAGAAGTAQSNAETLQTGEGEGQRIVARFGARDGRELLGVQPKAPEAVSPSTAQLMLLERTAAGERPIARAVAHAAYAPDGSILFLQRGVSEREGLLVEARGEERRVLLRDLADFAVSPEGAIALVRRLPEYRSSLELYAADGTHLRTLLVEKAPLSTPFFSPDGATLYFVSGRTGLLSLFAVAASGGRARQLTNASLRRMGPEFVAPPHRRDAIRFIAPHRLRYDTGDAQLELDLKSGRAQEVRQ